MTRVRTHHEFVQRPWWDRLGADAFLLHHAALAYVNAHHTDGLVPKAKAKALHSSVRSPLKQAAGLLDEGVWQEHDDAHYRVCEVRDDLREGGGRGDEQPSAAYVEQEAERARTRKENWKSRNAGSTAGRNGVRNAVRSRTRGSAGQGSAVQDPNGSGPAPRPTLVPDADCEHGVDLHASCVKCAQEATA